MNYKFSLPGGLLCCSLFLTLLSGCSKNDNNKENQPYTGKVVPVGTAKGPVVKMMIGASGGTLQSDDGQLTITVPAGALESSTAVSVQRITNTNPGGMGEAYRLLPHGNAFKKNVTIAFSYASKIDSITSDQTIGFAYQDERQVWKWKAGQHIDANNKKVLLETDHFSDWSFMEFLFLKPAYAMLEANASQNFQAVRCVPGDELMVPLVPQSAQSDIPVGEVVPWELKFIKDWKLIGPGNLMTLGNTAMYTAPATVEKEESATVELELNTVSGKAMLLSHIRIVGKEYLFVKVNGGAPLYLKGSAGRSTDGSFFIGTTTPGKWFVINGKFVKGSFAWNNGEGSDLMIQFAYSPSGSSHDFYGSYYFDAGKNLKTSGGALNVQSIDLTNRIIQGTFSIYPSGRISSNAGGQIETANIEGGFKLKYQE